MRTWFIFHFIFFPSNVLKWLQIKSEAHDMIGFVLVWSWQSHNFCYHHQYKLGQVLASTWKPLWGSFILLYFLFFFHFVLPVGKLIIRVPATTTSRWVNWGEKKRNKNKVTPTDFLTSYSQTGQRRPFGPIRTVVQSATALPPLPTNRRLKSPLA